MLIVLAIASCLSAGIIAGVFYGFSTFIMRALADLPAAHGIAAMQRINVVVLNPLFLMVFIGAAILPAIASLLYYVAANTWAAWLLGAAIAYTVGCFQVTMRFNVPKNSRLAQLEAGTPEAAAYWPIYVKEWLLWNHVRTAASAVASACSVVALLP